MTVTPTKDKAQPGSSSYKDTTTSFRSGPARMDEVEGLWGRLVIEDAVSLAEPINLDDGHYSLLRGGLECDGQSLEAESWSAAADPDYLRTLDREAVKRQDVIYELIQTEMHHVRTLKILRHVYIHELRQSLLLDDDKVGTLFPGVDALLTLHKHFLNCLKLRQSQSQEEGSPNSYQITELGDILMSQFSGSVGEKMKEWYSVFCSHHTEAVTVYKEQLQSNKKLQSLMKKIGQLALVRRLGIPECFLLVTQRITKYPVLVERLIQSTEAGTDEHESLLHGLAAIKDTICQVNEHVRDYEMASRLREICLRLEPKSVGRLKDGRLIRREDLIQGARTLLHEGLLTWKSSGRHKDIHAVLLSDMLVLLQDKDQKFFFAAVDNKPPVIALQNLILREVAHATKAMFLICACTSTPQEVYEMYELHTGSREERVAWMARIRDAINRCSEEDKLYQEVMSRLQDYQERLKVRDEHIKQCLSEKLHIFSAMYEDITGKESPSRGLLLRGDTTDVQQGETLLKGAIHEVENLQNLLFHTEKDPSKLPGGDHVLQWRSHRRAEHWGPANMKNHMSSEGDAAEWSGSGGVEADDAQLQETTYYSESQEQPADNDTLMPAFASPNSSFQAEVYDRVIGLAQGLYTLQVIVAQQDSQIELQHVLRWHGSRPSRPSSSALLEQEKQRNLEKHKEDLANLHKLQAQHREAQQRWEKERERQGVYMEALEAELSRREEECDRREEKLREEKAQHERQWESYQQGLERLRETTKAVEREKESLNQEKERIEDKLKKYMEAVNAGHGNYDDPYINLSNYQSFRGSLANVGNGGSSRPHILLASARDPNKETPPKVPPRKESMSVPPAAKPELPVHLVSTTNQVHKAAGVVQQIPTKLATLSKAKERGFRMKATHQRAHSAASIDVSQILPIRVTGKEGGSLMATSQSDDSNSSGHACSVKTSQSLHFRSGVEAPPPFPKEVLEKQTGKVIFL
ncbi:rho guanine nucleotide exchange factor 18a isoform X1 [Phyllopteryx taeniolatus]|uniref:rho guanine nucleotide exchange factor 18a isoform X1 n=1 Tax=Phyllopteryx taeniolatus TaxID=161469 RepID=UPI002AD560AC|nr:rho guanine nucleotide exchange factor 18a isoform X1 [Phyllopteryx taeniolatus]XP_061654342.1 rho guanine nucleotide exchange factor 18a isoform X1 [Phyllopteryx taeniolatus]XP_061654343.1 rho guanine nucleotide exchange factor 18a isoform X1 [Phyllopteryx taeniolatus]